MSSDEEVTEVLDDGKNSDNPYFGGDREQLLQDAAKIIMGVRAETYGTPEENLGCIAELWSSYLSLTIQAHDVAILMALLKIARLKADPQVYDSWVDLAGYAAIGSEVVR